MINSCGRRFVSLTSWSSCFLFGYLLLIVSLTTHSVCAHQSAPLSKSEKLELKQKVVQMFDHAFDSYMKYAYPADELMPLSCKGRYRNKNSPRGDIDEVLGNFTLTLVDSLDTLAMLGKIDKFELAVQNVIEHVDFDKDIIVSVFESNIRMLGGLLSSHVSLIYLRQKHYPNRFRWYKGELLSLALDLGRRLLPAFNTPTGLPTSRVNLRHGLTKQMLTNERDKYTCTACAGTLLLEFTLLSRLTGESVFEDKVVKAMDYLWEKRNRVSDLVGTTINVNDGEWLLKDASIGAGIDSYYEYLFKGYILLGDDQMLYRFNRHYDSIIKYMSVNVHDPASVDSNNDNTANSDGSYMRTVHMHMPNRQSRNYIDALLAFWPGLQVLKGDIKAAIKFHESLHHIVQKHDFLPEAVLFDHSIYWSSHLLRPEFLESTYYLYKATKDDYYVRIAKKMVEQMEKYSRVKCGYAAIADLKTKQHDDRLDSFVYAETFKYLYLMFVENDDPDLRFDIDDFIFSTEAHLIPLDMNYYVNDSSVADRNLNRIKELNKKLSHSEIQWKDKTCPNLNYFFSTSNLTDSVRRVRESVNILPGGASCKTPASSLTHKGSILLGGSNMEAKYDKLPLRASEFVAGRQDHLQIVNKMGIKLTTTPDGRVQLVHKSADAADMEQAELGILFMTDMFELSKKQSFRISLTDSTDFKPLSVVLLNNQELKEYQTGTAQFGYDLRRNPGVFGRLLIADPFDACTNLGASTSQFYYDKIVVVKRGNCMFVEKARHVEAAGGVGMIVVDNADDTTFSTSPLFSMSGDGVNNISIPSVFLFGKEGRELILAFNFNTNEDKSNFFVYIGDNSLDNNQLTGVQRSLTYNLKQFKSIFNHKLFSKQNKCSKSEYYLSRIRRPNQSQCHSSDYSTFGHIYRRVFRLPEPNRSDTITIITIDDVISIARMSGNKRELVLSLDNLIKSDNIEEAKKKDHDHVNQVFEMVFDRLLKKTQILKFSRASEYTKSLFNYVNSLLNPSQALSSADQLVLEAFAQDIDNSL